MEPYVPIKNLYFKEWTFVPVWFVCCMPSPHGNWSCTPLVSEQGRHCFLGQNDCQRSPRSDKNWL